MLEKQTQLKGFITNHFIGTFFPDTA